MRARLQKTPRNVMSLDTHTHTKRLMIKESYFQQGSCCFYFEARQTSYKYTIKLVL